MTIQQEAVEAAAKALYENELRYENTWYAPWDGDEHGILSEGAKDERRDLARAALEAALPHIAQEIEAIPNNYPAGPRNIWAKAITAAARIVRGEQ